MGRVNRYKRIKSYDPFYRRKHGDSSSKLSSEGNLCPGGEVDDQPVPKSFTRMMRGVQSIGKRNGRLKKHTRHVQVDPQGELETSDLGVQWKRGENESLRTYFDRIDVESNAHILETMRKKQGTSERRKKYFEKRKEKLRAKKARKKGDDNEALDFDDLKDQVKFGERVTAPPKLTTGAVPHRQKQLTRQCKQSVDQQKPVVVVGLKRKADIEQERCQAVETYSVAKKARHFRTEKTGAAISS